MRASRLIPDFGLFSALAKIRGPIRAFLSLRKTSPAVFWQKLLFASFWISIALFPIGYGFREVSPLVCLVFLTLYYCHGWRESVLANLPVRWLFLFAAALVLIGVAFSIHPWASFLHAGMGVNKSYILPFIGMECAKSEKQLRELVWAFVFACFWEGIDGVWQICTGRDFIMGYAPNAGRLTGSLGDYTVGNYLALAFVPACAVWFILRGRMGRASSLFIFCALFWPTWVLLVGASSRSSILAIAGAVFLWQATTRGLKYLRTWLYPALIMAMFAICQPSRLLPSAVTSDNRWDLWRLAWKVFLEHPFFGAGAGQYNAAFREMGLAPEREVVTISHPHNLYLDILCEHGIVGFACAAIFIGGFLIWTFSRIYPRLKDELRAGEGGYWAIAAWFWLGFAAWLVNGVFGHDFYRIWWLAEAMCALGVTIGAVVSGTTKDC